MVEYIYFRCEECNAHLVVNSYKDVFNSKGNCKYCNSTLCSLYETSITKMDMFMLKLKGKDVSSILRSKLGDRLQ